MDISFELFPPKLLEAEKKLLAVSQTLNKNRPSYFSVTFGAGGSTRDNTLKVVSQLQQLGLTAAPHISGICAVRSEIDALLTAYQAIGVKRLVVLRGDRPSGSGYGRSDFPYASDLLAYIRKTTGDYFHLEVGCYPEKHPQAVSAVDDLQHFKEKVDAGANGAITQFFYNPEAYYYFLEACHKNQITVPITPGIMPIYNLASLQRFSSLCGADIPRWLQVQIERFDNDEASLEAFVTDYLSRFCEQLIHYGAPGLHFYTLNKAKMVNKIIQQLGLVASL